VAIGDPSEGNRSQRAEADRRQCEPERAFRRAEVGADVGQRERADEAIVPLEERGRAEEKQQRPLAAVERHGTRKVRR
jgi:hypothetical protein